MAKNPWYDQSLDPGTALSAEPHAAYLYNGNYYAYQLDSPNKLKNGTTVFKTTNATKNPNSENPRPNINNLKQSNVQCFYCADYKLSNLKFHGLTIIPTPNEPICDWTNKIDFKDWGNSGIQGIYNAIDNYINKHPNDAYSVRLKRKSDLYDKTYAYMCYIYQTGYKFRKKALLNSNIDCYPTGQPDYPTGPYVRIKVSSFANNDFRYPIYTGLGDAYNNFIILYQDYNERIEDILTYISLTSQCTINGLDSLSYPIEEYNNNFLSAPSADDIISCDYLTYLSGEICAEATRRSRSKDINTIKTKIANALNAGTYNSQIGDQINHNAILELNKIILDLSTTGIHFDYRTETPASTLPLSSNNILTSNACSCVTDGIILANAVSVLTKNLEFIRRDCICYGNCGLYAVCYCFGNKPLNNDNCPVVDGYCQIVDTNRWICSIVKNDKCTINAVLDNDKSPY